MRSTAIPKNESCRSAAKFSPLAEGSGALMRILGSLEVVLVDLDDREGLPRLDSDPVADHQLGEALTVDQDDAGPDALRVLAGTRGERTRGDEHPASSTHPVQRTDERLNLRPAHGVVGRITLGLHIDTVQTERVLINNTVDAAVTGPTDPGSPALGASVPHGDEHIEHRLFQERRVL